MMFVLGLVSLQIVLFPLHMALYRQMVPEELSLAESIFSFIRHHIIFQILIPPHAADFFLYYGLGFVGVTVVFTAILMERCWRLKGLMAGILYIAAAALAVLSPFFFEYLLYPYEIFRLTGAIGFTLFWVSIWVSKLLLTQKITV